MFAPVVTRFITYDVPLDEACVAYCDQVMALPAMKEWVAAAEAEPDEIDELPKNSCFAAALIAGFRWMRSQVSYAV
jgi:hypothetical protein